MPQEEPRIRIELTHEQRKQIKEASGEDVTAIEFTARQLEQRIAPSLISNHNETLLEESRLS